VRILLWHGYLLGGTRRVDRLHAPASSRGVEPRRARVTVFCQEPHPELYDVGGEEVVRPDVGGVLPVFVLDRYLPPRPPRPPSARKPV